VDAPSHKSLEEVTVHIPEEVAMRYAASAAEFKFIPRNVTEKV
jgi:hypothetical protein